MEPLTLVAEPLIPLATMKLCHPSQQEVESLSPLAEPGLSL